MEHSQLPSSGPSESQLSGVRLEYDKLTGDVKKATQELGFLMENLPLASARYRQAVLPLYDQLRTVRKNFLVELDEQLLDGTLNRHQKKRVTEYLLIQIRKFGGADEDLKSMFNRYAEEPLTESQPEDSGGHASDWGNDDDDGSSAIHETAPWEKASADHQDQRRNRKKQNQAQQLNRSVKSVYTGLMKVFHPDTETDPERKAEKEEISKQITVAYGKKDFMGLLRLESEFLNNPKQRPGLLNDVQIQQYIEVLKEQKTELRKQLGQLKADYGFLFEAVATGSEKPLMQLIKSEKTDIESAIQGYRARIRILRESEGPELKMLLEVMQEEIDENDG